MTRSDGSAPAELAFEDMPRATTRVTYFARHIGLALSLTLSLTLALPLTLPLTLALPLFSRSR